MRSPVLALTALSFLSARAALARPAGTEARDPLEVGGYVEAFYAHNLNEPSNGLTNYRGFDNRHATFTLANAALDLDFEKKPLSARLTLQVGHTPSTYYLAEPRQPGASGANASGAELWKYLQQAHLGYEAPLGRGLLVEAGLFLSPIGVEGMAVRDNWHFSRSNLFFGLPFYHTGIRASYPLARNTRATLAAYNGWNSVVDNNRDKSVSAQVVQEIAGRLTLSLLYFGGVERPEGSPEGQPFRHLVDAHATLRVTDFLSVALHGDAGFERGELGRSSWLAGAAYARLRAARWLYVAGRADGFRDSASPSEEGRQGAARLGRLFWPGSWVASGTATLDLRPVDSLAVMLELRHDRAAAPTYFGGAVGGNGEDFVPNRRTQSTLTLGASAWF